MLKVNLEDFDFLPDELPGDFLSDDSSYRAMSEPAAAGL